MLTPQPHTASRLTPERVHGWRADLATMQVADDDGARWELLRGLEELKAAAAAAQARITVDFAASQRRSHEAAGADRRDVGRGIAAQVGLARRDGPWRGARHVGLARALVAELPHTLEALTMGTTTEWRATLVARETACLSAQDRMTVDSELAQRPGGIGALGDRAAETESRAIAQRLDPAAATRRARRAESERRVTLRPAPDTMSLLSGLLPVRQGVAVLASLTRHADSLRAVGDVRTRGQIMADTLVERVTGQTTADAVPVEIQLVMSDHTLMAADPTDNSAPARIAGFGPVPAPLARSWVRASPADVWVRRLYAKPSTGSLVAMDSRRRRFTGKLRELVVARDSVCRTPWCGAPIRHVDHTHPAADGGPTSTANGQGLCEACNQAKEAPGWRSFSSGAATVTQLPTGHRVASRPPPVTALPPPALQSRAEFAFRGLLLSG